MKTISKHGRDMRRQAAEKRQAAYAGLTLAQKLAKLPIGGAKKQRARLEAQAKRAK